MQNQNQLDLSRIGQNNQALLQGSQNNQQNYQALLAGLAQNNAAGLAGANFYNNAALANQANQQQNYQAMLSGIGANNQANAQGYANQIAGATAGNDLFKTLGQGLVANAPQVQGNFTTTDLEKLKNDPGLLNPNVYGGGGIASNTQLKQLGGSAAQDYQTQRLAQQQAALDAQKKAQDRVSRGRGY